MRPPGLLAAALLFGFSAVAVAADDSRKELIAQLQSIAENSGGQMGISARSVKTGERVQLNASARYQMASVVKVAVALKLLDEVDHNHVSLTQKIEIKAGDLSPGSGEILKELDPGEPLMSTTVLGLLESMMTVSDNTATDHLMAMAGGPKAVTKHLRELGITGIDVNRPTAQLVADAWGFRLPPMGERTRANLKHAVNITPLPARQAAAQRFLQDDRDTTTPDAMVAILEKLVTGKALSKASTELLLDIMAKCKTGPKRLKGELPPGLPVAHKTGTLTRVATNDVGIFTMPWDQGPLVVAVFVHGSALPIPQQERAIAAAGAALYRYYNR